MKRNSRFSLIFSGVAGAALSLLLPLQAIAKDYTSINIFGDSLADAGNLFNLTGLPPSPPYAQKLSNGVVWVEPFAEELGLAPALASDVVAGFLDGTAALPTEGINFALGGSLSSDQNVGLGLPGLQQQIGAFSLLKSVVPTDPTGLFVLMAGGNDYNQAAVSIDPATIGPTTIGQVADEVTNNITSAASALIGLGAQHLIVPNLPDLSLQPRADQLDAINPQSSLLFSQLSTQHNQLLAAKLTELSSATSAKITQLDLNSFVNQVFADPDDFGFSNIEASCLTNVRDLFLFDGVCDNPDEFAFWDDVHPTDALHRAIASFAVETIKAKNEANEPQAVPEPISVISLLLGAGIVVSTRKLS